jgi:transcriptional regulator with XRE-family HTH domain
MNIGEKIKARIKSEKISVVEFAQLLEISKASAHRLLNRSSIDTDVLFKICFVLKYDFFQDFSARIDDREWKSNQYLKVKFKSMQ